MKAILKWLRKDFTLSHSLHMSASIAQQNLSHLIFTPRNYSSTGIKDCKFFHPLPSLPSTTNLPPFVFDRDKVSFGKWRRCGREQLGLACQRILNNVEDPLRAGRTSAGCEREIEKTSKRPANASENNAAMWIPLLFRSQFSLTKLSEGGAQRELHHSIQIICRRLFSIQNFSEPCRIFSYKIPIFSYKILRNNSAWLVTKLIVALFSTLVGDTK